MASDSAIPPDGLDRRHVSVFEGSDGARIAYRRSGAGDPLICVPGGPMQSPAYLGDLGGLTRHRPCVLLELRGTGNSDVPADPTSYRCDRQVDDLEALRRHLGLDRVDVLAHSAGAAVALLYAARHPERVGRLVLVTPSPRPAGVDVSDADRRQVAELRRGEPWFAAAFAAFEHIWAGAADESDWDAITPFTYGRWDANARRQDERWARERNDEAARHYYAEGTIDAVAVRSALNRLDAPVLVLAGGYDVALPPHRAADYARLFGNAECVVQPQAGHYPWLDDPVRFTDIVTAFLARPR